MISERPRAQRESNVPLPFSTRTQMLCGRPRTSAPHDTGEKFWQLRLPSVHSTPPGFPKITSYLHLRSSVPYLITEGSFGERRASDYGVARTASSQITGKQRRDNTQANSVIWIVLNITSKLALGRSQVHAFVLALSVFIWWAIVQRDTIMGCRSHLR